MSARRSGNVTDSPRVKTGDQVRDDFERTGKSVSAWAREHGFEPSLVFEVLEGRVKGKRGKSHKIAVLLGMKIGEVRA